MNQIADASAVVAPVPLEEPGAQRPPRRSLLVGTAATLLLNLATLVVNFVLVLVLTRALGKHGYGAYAYAFAWATFLSVPASLGLNPLVIRHVASYEAKGQWGLLRGALRQVNLAVAAASALVVGGGALAGWLLHGSEPELFHPFLIGLLLVPLTALTMMRQSALQGLHRVILARIPETVLMPGLFLALVLAVDATKPRMGPTWAMTLNVAAAVAAFAVGVWLLWRVTPAAAHRATPEYELRTWARSVPPLFALGLLLVVNTQVGTIALGAMDSADSAGVYSVASRVAAFTSFLFLAATYPLYPTVARLWNAGDRSGLQRLLTTSARTVFLAAVLVAAVFFVAARPILHVFASGFGEGATALRILAVGELVKVAAGFGGLALLMTPFEGSMTRGTAVGVALNVALTAALVPVWGLDGAAVGSVASAAVSSFYVAWLAWRKIGIFAPALGRARRAT